jgi:hypothetical protein
LISSFVGLWLTLDGRRIGEDEPGETMATEKKEMRRAKLIEALNEDLSHEYQAIIAYVNYSQVLKRAAYMSIAANFIGDLRVDCGIRRFDI